METKELFTDQNELAVDELLHFYYEIQEGRGIRGDYGASEYLLDLEEAMENAELTDRQAEALELAYFKDLEDKDGAVVMGIARRVFHRHVQYAVRKIANTYKGDIL